MLDQQFGDQALELAHQLLARQADRGREVDAAHHQRAARRGAPGRPCCATAAGRLVGGSDLAAARPAARQRQTAAWAGAPTDRASVTAPTAAAGTAPARPRPEPARRRPPPAREAGRRQHRAQHVGHVAAQLERRQQHAVAAEVRLRQQAGLAGDLAGRRARLHHVAQARRRRRRAGPPPPTASRASCRRRRAGRPHALRRTCADRCDRAARRRARRFLGLLAAQTEHRPLFLLQALAEPGEQAGRLAGLALDRRPAGRGWQRAARSALTMPLFGAASDIGLPKLTAARAAPASAGIWQSTLRFSVRSTSSTLTAERRASIAPLVAMWSWALGATSCTSCCRRMASRTPGSDRSVISRMSRRGLDHLALDHRVAARHVGDDPAEAAMDRPQEIAGRVRARLEAAGRRLLGAHGIEVFALLLRDLLDEQRVDAVGLVERLAQRVDRLEVERQHERAVVQVEVDQQHLFPEAGAQHGGDRHGGGRGADAAARADDRQRARLGGLGAPAFAAIAPPVRSRSSSARSTARPIAPSANGIAR